MARSDSERGVGFVGSRPELVKQAGRAQLRTCTSAGPASVSGGQRPLAAHQPAGDFRLMSRRVVDNVVSLEGRGFLRGLAGPVGFRQACVCYDRDLYPGGARQVQPFLGSLLIGLSGIVGFPTIVVAIGPL